MTTPEQPPYDPNATTTTGTPYGAGSQPAGGTYGGSPPPVQTVRKGPGWGAYVITVIALLVLAAVITFVLQNSDRINIKFFNWKKTNVKEAVALGAAGLAGLIAGLFLGLIPWMSARRKLKAARRGASV